MQRNAVSLDVASPTTQITLEEVATARPKRGTGAPARCISHKAAILALLRERGLQGVLGSELYAHPELYGRSPRNRVSELRKDGRLIEGKPHSPSDWHYRLIRDNAGAEHQPTSPEKPSISPYMQRIQREQEETAPLFAGMRS